MCGFAGMIGDIHASEQIFLALRSLQHRGQDSAGIGSMESDYHFHYFKDIGSVVDVFSNKELERLKGTAAIGQVRYPTIGGGERADAQPFFSRRPGLLMAHNGNITNYEQLKNILFEKSVILSSNCDIEPVMYIVCDELMKRKEKRFTLDDAVAALRSAYALVKGAYSVVFLMYLDGEPTMCLFRDPWGIRPAVWAEKDGTYLAASESICMDILGFSNVQNIAPGEAIFFRQGKPPIRKTILQKTPAPCIFEYVYFARPDSILDNDSAYEMRLKFGRALAREWLQKKIEVDVVMPIPESSRPATTSFAETIQKPVREGFIKDRYSGRTFIMPDRASRESALRLKLNPMSPEITDKRIVMLDDSIVRGTTIGKTLKLVKEKHPAAIHLAIYSPPVLHPCYYGIDMSIESELIANQLAQELGYGDHQLTVLQQRELEIELAHRLEIDSITFLSVDGLLNAFNYPACAACFNGEYPFQVDADHKNAIIANRDSAGR